MSSSSVFSCQSGRTLAELLGTLAVMGVLTLGGIAAYHRAILHYQTNEVISDLSHRAVIYSAQVGQRTSFATAGFESANGLGLPVAVEANEEGAFDLIVGEVPPALCQSVIRTNWSVPYQIWVNGDMASGRPELCTQSANEMVFVFRPGSDGCSSDSECPCGQCIAGACQSTCSGKDVCLNSFDTTTYQCCDLAHRVGDKCCSYPDGAGNCCNSAGNNCCPPDRPIMGRNGTCYACDESQTITVDQRSQTCGRCPNRIYRSATYNYLGWCIPKQCPPEAPLMSYSGVCSACGTTVEMRDIINGAGDTSSCQLCPENALFDDRLCLVCPDNMIVQNGQCTCGGGFMAGYQSGTSGNPTCYACGSDNLRAIAFSYKNNQNPCSACPDRMVVSPQFYYFKYCALKTCPTGYMHDRYGHCQSCSAAGNIEFKPSSLTNSCSECGSLRYTDGNYCRKCPNNLGALTPEQRVECGGT